MSVSNSRETDPLLGSVAPNEPTRNHHELTHFPPQSTLNPRNWPMWRKWLVVAAITPIDLSVSWGASGFSPAEEQFAVEFGISDDVARLGLSLYILGLALGPMSLAPLSEVFGRTSIYIYSYGIFLLFLAGTALSTSVPVFMVLRFFAGLFAAVTIANFGGTIADMFPHERTGYAMSVYLWAATCGSPSGFFLFSPIARAYGWRAVFWALLFIDGALWIILVVALWSNETRHTTILRREARRNDKQIALRRRGAGEIAKVILTRPLSFLLTEAIVIFAALYNGVLYGISFLFNVVFVQVFGRNGHGFDTFGVGCAFLGVAVGVSIGPLTNLWQEARYRRETAARGDANVPEARIQTSKVAAIVFPVSLLWFAWSTDPSVHPLVPIIASTFWGWSFYTLILMTFQYTEDSYRTFSASALAGIGLVRNIAGAAFPMCSRYIFSGLGYSWGGTLLAGLGVLLAPIPFILERYGHKLRESSPWARQHVTDLTDAED